jgi:hypothetical protein
MYVEILSGALKAWPDDLVDDDLVDHVLSCRSVLPDRDLGAGTWSDVALVAEVSYDRALITLAASRGIDVAPTNFVHPRIERERLEAALAEVGVDLEDLGSHSRRINQHEAGQMGEGADEDSEI